MRLGLKPLSLLGAAVGLGPPSLYALDLGTAIFWIK
jgi:hypothetical protein